MALSPGDRLGGYEIVGLLGAGGMGEVYRARDLALSRSVAIKILPDLFARDPERLARFAREARVLASLNHPNIAAIYGLEQADGAQALVLELVEGPTLADRIAAGPMPVDDALPIARQIARALEAAHAQGIVHRDLKPANIKVRPDGTVKVLDFGLAKAWTDETRPPAVTESPTITSPAATRMGVILGTAAYMSPEQARGKPVDKRSDIWAFGGVLYEMVAGRRAFGGDEVSDTLADVLRSEPDWTRLPAATAPAVVRVLHRCLQKDPNARYHDIADARLDLDERPPSTPATGAPAPPRLKWLERAAWALVAALLGVALVSFGARQPAPPATVRFSVSAPDKTVFGAGLGTGSVRGTSGAALSPDGTRLAWVASDQTGTTRLWVRALDSFNSQALSGTEGAIMPFWSPDSRQVGFFAGGRLRRVPASGGPPTTICDAVGIPRGASWSSRGVILFTVGTPPDIASVSADGGTPARIDAARLGGAGIPLFPHFLPDGRHYLFWTRTADREPAVYVGSLDPAFIARRIDASDTSAVYAPPDSVLFVRGGQLMRQPFSIDRLEVTGRATPLADDVLSVAVGVGDFSASGTGVLAYREEPGNQNQFAWVSRSGRLIETVGPPGRYRTPALSPDGKRLAFTDVGKADIWIYDLGRRSSTRFTSERDIDTCPVWAPDGTKIYYRNDGSGLFEKSAAGSGPPRRLLDQFVNGPSQVSRDGKWLLYFAGGPTRTLDVVVLPLTGSATPKPVVETAFSEVEPQWSPDGRWLAYVSNETGRNEVYVQPFPASGERWRVSTDGGRQPLWRADGRELFFVSEERKFYAMAVTAKGAPFDSAPQYLFEMRANVINTRNSYLPSADGQRFLVNMVLDTPDPPINVVVNWAAGLK